MTPEQYIESVLSKYAVPRGPNSPAELLGSVVAGPLQKWAGQQLNALQYSGSYAKETGIRGVSDVDVFISLKSDTTDTMKEIYGKLFSFAYDNGWAPILQNVSVGVTINGTKGDLVPGRVQAGYQNYHSLYLRKRDSWTQTNVALHVDTVRNSGRLKEIRAVKIWRMLHALDIPSLYLELFTINALSGHSRSTLGENVMHVLRAISESITSARIVDPANTNNVLSDELTHAEKQQVATQAAHSVREQYWKRIIW